jgi:hypothetical protein
LAGSAEDDFVAVGKEFAEFTSRELEWDGAALGQFKQAAFGTRLRA